MDSLSRPFKPNYELWKDRGQTKGVITKDLVGVKSIRCKIYIPFNYVRDYLTDHRIIAVWERLQESQIYISMLWT